jgi:hypothetical protein
MDFIGSTGMVYFSLFDEANKLRELIKGNPSEHPTLCNDEDLLALPFKASHTGFFMVLVPGWMHGIHGNFSYSANEDKREEAKAFVTNHTVQQLVEGLLLISTACSWDRVPDKVRAATALGFAAIAFSTPERLQVLGECAGHMR